jgi:hypothetical protein
MPDTQWPLFDLRVRTPRLEIRFPTDADLYRLNELADLGIHEPSAMPFSIPWTDTRRRNATVSHSSLGGRLGPTGARRARSETGLVGRTRPSLVL